MTQLKHLFGAVLMLALIMPVLALAQDEKERGVGNVVYVPTPQVVVDEMLRMAKVGSADFVIDRDSDAQFGSGDWREKIVTKQHAQTPLGDCFISSRFL